METKRLETAKMLMSFYNTLKGTKCRIGENEDRANIVLNALDRMNGDIGAVRNHIRTYIENHDGEDFGWRDCFDACRPAVQAAPAAPSEQSVNGAMDILSNAMVKILAETQADKIESAILNGIEDKIRNFVKSEYGVIERKVVTVVDGKRQEMGGIAHEKLDEVIKFVANNEPVYLTGPAGSGKNELCKQVAKALNLDFYFTNAVTQEYQLKGFTDAMGNYQPTQFYKAFTEGGLFMLDEMDASIPEVLVILNAAIANGYFDFPAPIGFKQAHPNFRVIAAGNTLGHGADFEYVGRVQLDGASLDRFAIVKVGYSKTIEDAMANGDTELADFCRHYRTAAEKAGLNVIVSYRAIKRLAKMVQLLDITEALDTCLVKGLEKDDIHQIIQNINFSGKYVSALMRLA